MLTMVSVLDAIVFHTWTIISVQTAMGRYVTNAGHCVWVMGLMAV